MYLSSMLFYPIFVSFTDVDYYVDLAVVVFYVVSVVVVFVVGDL